MPGDAEDWVAGRCAVLNAKGVKTITGIRLLANGKWTPYLRREDGVLEIPPVGPWPRPECPVCGGTEFTDREVTVTRGRDLVSIGLQDCQTCGSVLNPHGYKIGRKLGFRCPKCNSKKYSFHIRDQEGFCEDCENWHEGHAEQKGGSGENVHDTVAGRGDETSDTK